MITTDLFTAGKKILSVFFTAGYTGSNSLTDEILFLQQEGVDLVEIGIPFSDPLADGEVIQHSSQAALKNGINVEIILDELVANREKFQVPLILMGYLNTIFAYGTERFLARCKKAGITDIIVPDMSPRIYEREFSSLFGLYSIKPVFLITPCTSDKRINFIDSLGGSFIYAVSTNSTTGNVSSFDPAVISCLERIRQCQLTTPVLTGFGICNKSTFDIASAYSCGGIIGSAYIKAIEDNRRKEFLDSVRPGGKSQNVHLPASRTSCEKSI